MEVIKGIFAEAKVFADDLEQYAKAQLTLICDNEVSKGSKIRVMPDVHPGKVGTIGLTMTIRDRVIPNLLGIDIGCGITIVKLKDKKLEFQKLDSVIRERVPSGSNIRNKAHGLAKDFEYDRLQCASKINRKKAPLSLGSLGGGNHFIEVDRDSSGNIYLIQELLHQLGIDSIDVDVERDRSFIMKQYISYIDRKSIAARYPEEVKYWDIEKNKGLTPEMVNATSNIKYWWKCEKGHSFKAAPGNRLGNGSGCPYCSGRLVIKGVTDLQTRYPDIAKEWDYEKNAPLTPSEVPCGTQKKVWWKCDKGHSYQRIILDRVTYNSKCPYCSDRSTLLGYNDIKTTHPELLNEWDYAKNIDVSPDEMRSNSRKKVWWKCSKGHSWDTTVLSRIKGSGCPYCSNQLFKQGYNDLKTVFPELAEEWDYDKNVDLRPEDIIAGGIRKVWWKCNKGHEWQATVSSRVTSHTGCPYCANQLFKKGYNDLKSQYPELASEWNYKRNGGIGPEDVVAGGEKKVWWKCKKGHEWKAQINGRINGRGCPYCSNKKLLTGYNDFATVYPDLISEWNYEKNGGLTPDTISCGSMTKIWWKCSKGHEWYQSPNQRRRKDGTMARCRYCAGKVAIPGETDLATVRPDLVKEWDYGKNTDIKPENVKEYSAKKAWWRCSKCGYGWFATISNRSSGAGCPKCTKKVK